MMLVGACSGRFRNHACSRRSLLRAGAAGARTGGARLLSAVLPGVSGRSVAMRDQRRPRCRGMALVNPVGELVRLVAALARSRAAVIFSRLKAGVDRTWARGR
jgi:hypothetical protein